MEFRDMELLRLLLRSCQMDVNLEKKVIESCRGNINIDGEVEVVLQRLKSTVEDMEQKSMSTEQLIERVKEAKPINAVHI